MHPDAPVELYSKVARGALACWFGPKGSFKGSHVFYANASPPTAGGEAEIVIHKKDTVVGDSPRAIRAFKVTFTRSGDGSLMTAENLRFPEPVAKDMYADLARWARGQDGCSVMGAGGWNAKAGQETDAEPASKKPEKKRRPVKQKAERSKS